MNNFDMSSTGTNIEFYIFRDNEDACRLFDEAFERVPFKLPEGYYGDTFFYKDFGENEWDGSVQDRHYAVDYDNPKELIRNLYKYIGGDIRELYRSLEVTSKDGTEAILEAIESYYQWEDSYINFLHCYYPTKFSLYMSRGYSQGDCVTVLLPSHCENSGHWEAVKTAINHYLWDSPIYTSLTVDGEDYTVELEDSYDYDQDKVLTAVDKAIDKLPQEKREAVRDFLIGTLPKDLEYI